MCNDITEAENDAYLEFRLTRRAAGVGAGATVASLLTSCTSTPAPVGDPDSNPEPTVKPASDDSSEKNTSARMVTIETADGSAEGFFASPKSGKHPGVLMWPDVAGLRDAYQTMATRLANQGYAVLVVNPYYRGATLPLLDTFSEWQTDEGRAKIQPLRDALTPEAISSDGAAFAAWLDQQQEVDKKRKLATTGYCMGGPFTFRTAAAVPKRVGVIASFHGGGLVTTDSASPHTLLDKRSVSALICIAQNDDERDPEAKDTLREAASQAGVSAEIEVYPAQHGWCALDSPVYDQEQAERAWQRMLATFEGGL